jgi:hypothetical protein
MKYMNCHFCQNPLPPAMGRVYDPCQHCPLPVKHVGSQSNFEICSLVSIRLNEYEIMFHLQSKTCRIWEGMKALLEFNFLPDLTPQNAEEKLPILLTFS